MVQSFRLGTLPGASPACSIQDLTNRPEQIDPEEAPELKKNKQEAFYHE